MDNSEDEPTASGKYKIFPLIILLGLITLVIAVASPAIEPVDSTGTLPTPGAMVTTQPSPEAGALTEVTSTAPPVATLTATTAAVTATAVAVDPTPSPIATAVPGSVEPTPPTTTSDLVGALITLTLESQVGVLLNEIPAEMRDSAAAVLLAESESYWTELARQQVRLTQRRLDFRNFAYDGKGQLPLPPESVWSIQIDPSGPRRETTPQGQDLVLINYLFSSTLLTDADSPGQAEPALAAVGGVWDEPFTLPLDPNLLLQRTGNACLNEAGYPPNSYDSENAWIFYDHTCQASSSGPLGCHRTQLPTFSCVEALERRVGTVNTAVRFERLAWDPEMAAQVRVGEVTHVDAPDVAALDEDLANHRIIYRYFAPNSCALNEGCVGGTGWRRLLQFNATIHNIGGVPLDIGLEVAEDTHHNLFKYDACHDHFHFIHYGYFSLDDNDQELSSKQAFCVQSTSRFSNNEYSPLTHPYSCRAQGVQAGWVDEYIAGLDCQWIDITDVFKDTEVLATPLTMSLGFEFNPDQFLCEGTPLLDEDGNYQWEETGFTTGDGAPIRRPQCDFIPDWGANNMASLDVDIPPTGGLINSTCAPGQFGPLRNCGFIERDSRASCVPGQQVQLSCRVDNGAAPQTMRLCETSDVLGTGVACTFQDAILNTIIGINNSVEVNFTCPGPRDELEPGGAYSFYTAPLFPNDEPQAIICEEIP